MAPFRFRPRRLHLETLEVRLPLDGSAALWLSAPSLTLSFPSDGTEVAGSPSALFAELDSLGDSATWQGTIVRAFDTWLEPLGGKVQVVDDSGDPFGTLGPTQGDPRFGDIRVASVPMPGGPTAMGVPHNAIVSGTWAGDIIFNSDVDFRNLDELYSVALHEAGHVLGLDHSSDPASPMSVHGISDNLVPTAADIAHLKSLYGVLVESESGGNAGEHENEDESDDAPRNDQLFWAQSVNVPPLANQWVRYEVHGRIASPDDVDYYVLQPPTFEAEGLENLIISVRSTDVAGLIPAIAVYDKEGKLLETEILRNDSGVLIAQVQGAEADDRIYLSVRPASALPEFQLGAYEVVAGYEATPLALTSYANVELDKDAASQTLPLHVDHPELVYFALRTQPDDHQQPVVVWATIHDSQGALRYQAATVAGETRSAPTVFLEPGDYRITLSTSTTDETPLDHSVQVELIGDSVSLPFGPGLVDPTTDPVLPCNQAGADPNYCLPGGQVVTDPIIWPGQPVAGTEPAQPVSPPTQSPDWWYWIGANTDNGQQPAPRHNGLRPADVNNDGLITPRDALLIVTYLNDVAAGGGANIDTWFLDVNQDNLVSPIDVLLVISALV